jgi:hypothetical protein
VAWFRKQKRKATSEGATGKKPCPKCGQASFTPVTQALPRTPGQREHEEVGDLVDQSTGHCEECGLIAWGQVYSSGGSSEENARRALLNNTLLLAWTEECRERRQRGEPTTKQHESEFLNGARNAFGREFEQLNHKRFVTICLENAQARLRKR